MRLGNGRSPCASSSYRLARSRTLWMIGAWQLEPRRHLLRLAELSLVGSRPCRIPHPFSALVSFPGCQFKHRVRALEQFILALVKAPYSVRSAKRVNNVWIPGRF